MASRTALALPIAAILIGALASGRVPAAGAATASISVSPASVSFAAGADISLDYTVANVASSPGIGGYLIAVKFDPAVLEMTGMTDSGWVPSGENIVFCGASEIDNDAGTAVQYCSPVPLFGAPGVATDAPRAIARSSFHAKGAGTSTIDIAGSYLHSPSDTDIASTLENGSVTVTAAGTAAGPTSTPRPAATRTAAPPTATASAAPTPAGASTPEAGAAAGAQLDGGSSTKPGGGTLSNVEAPRTGSGEAPAEEASGATWWIPALVAAGLALLACGGAVALDWRRRSAKA